ncbi:MAG: hypothetical protein FJW96_12740 [Actinobacteria bacterium]|nr:hypothetical protein [Actinomycetota bacterium]
MTGVRTLERPAPLADDIARVEADPPRRIPALDPLWLVVAAVSVAVAAFLGHQLMAWPPHEDEALALLTGRDSLGGVISHVTGDRGGAPLHFLVAWAVAHLGLGLGGLRAVSAAFAVGSLPLIALLARRLAGREVAIGTVVLAAASWIVLFHGVYGRMYSLFLFLSLVSCLALLRARDSGTRADWGRWLVAILLCVAAHPYGALVVASQGVAALATRWDRRRATVAWFATMAILAVPFWLTDIVLAGRFDVGVGGGGAKLGGPGAVVDYLYEAAGDMTAGWPWVLAPVLIAAGVGLLTAPRRAKVLSAAFVAVPAVAFIAARLGSSAAPESRHLIFVAPFFLLCVVLGIRWLARGIRPAVGLAVGTLAVAAVAWAWQRTPPLFEWEPSARQEAREAASRYVASTGLDDDLLLGYDPLFLGAWEDNRAFRATVLPRADGQLLLKILRRTPTPLGHGVFVLDKSDTSNVDPQLYLAPRRPLPEEAFSARGFGPFLVIRTREPVETIDGYLFAARQAMLLGQSLEIGDADINRATIERAQALYDASRWGDASAGASSDSR